ncbi:hypothetical protein ACFV2Q_23115 [Streptomyces sp. NPDC059650]|uniref:hypothetical protein n=1 Tax=Streptomyces sp. NPDC059650 TaxID=3346896 RepID=UPI0036883C13
MAIALARTHGRLAWFLASCIHMFAHPSLAGTAGRRRNGLRTLHPASEQFTDAENAVWQLAAVLTCIAA